MSMPHPDDHSDLREALRCDAARMQEPPFDVALHHATLRRIRSWADTGTTRSGLRLIPPLAAVAAVLLVIVMIFTRREPSRGRPDVAAAIASSQNTIASLSVEPPSLFPAWASPTASMLDQPRLPQ
jgi:hypothetical protein